MRTLELSLDVIQQATGTRPPASGPLLERLQRRRWVSVWEQELAKAQELVEVLDVAPPARRASADCQLKYNDVLARVDRVLSEAPAGAHPRALAAAVRRQVVAAMGGRPPSPEVEDILVDEPDTWPEDAST